MNIRCGNTIHTQSLVVVVWLDNNLVKTLFNYHKSQIIPVKMMRRKIEEDGIQEKNQSPVHVPIQNIAYSNKYYQIVKSNQIKT
jgi:hypothetical protein